MRQHRTRSGTFAIHRASNGLLTLEHVPTGLFAGFFSHLRVRTFKAALEGMEQVEQRLYGVRDDLASKTPSDTTLNHLQTEWRR